MYLDVPLSLGEESGLGEEIVDVFAGPDHRQKTRQSCGMQRKVVKAAMESALGRCVIDCVALKAVCLSCPSQPHGVFVPTHSVIFAVVLALLNRSTVGRVSCSRLTTFVVYFQMGFPVTICRRSLRLRIEYGLAFALGRCVDGFGELETCCV